ncbi:hypothetical protein J2Y48_003055 [Mycoplana sp. BE70]|uniref:DUF6455 family protein n=1 Tax=Mycoplana sp. BE70 TaxID=2817775 RepID=UPI0028550365|nr:DUF6455 family protein [Mycoplana sp. BE70]MDR6757758.1 hypothetical protein [Mycoplana sp. BE70]
MSDHSLLHNVMEMMTTRWKDYREGARMHRKLAQLGPGEMHTFAADCGLTPDQLRDVVRRGPRAAVELGSVMMALGIDTEAVRHKDSTAFNDMTRVCAVCSHKSSCRQSIRKGTIAIDHVAFCNNSDVLAEFQGESSVVRTRLGATVGVTH